MNVITSYSPNGENDEGKFVINNNNLHWYHKYVAKQLIPMSHVYFLKS